MLGYIYKKNTKHLQTSFQVDFTLDYKNGKTNKVLLSKLLFLFLMKITQSLSSDAQKAQ